MFFFFFFKEDFSQDWLHTHFTDTQHNPQNTMTHIWYTISVYLKYSICKCFFFFNLKTRQVSQLVAYIVSKKEGSIHQSLFLSPRCLCSSFDSSGTSRGLGICWPCIWGAGVRMGGRGWGVGFVGHNTEAGQSGHDWTDESSCSVAKLIDYLWSRSCL